MDCAEDDWQIPCVLGKLDIKLNHNPLLEKMLTLHYAIIMES